MTPQSDNTQVSVPISLPQNNITEPSICDLKKDGTEVKPRKKKRAPISPKKKGSPAKKISENGQITKGRKQIINISNKKREMILKSENTKEHELECDFCEFVADSSFNLKVHVEFKHTTNKNYFPCSMCDETFKLGFDRDLHLAEVHNKARYSCNNCDKAFVNRGDLINHIIQSHPEIVRNGVNSKK
eukprot:TRINITY_DN14316_c0_g1_i4.p1 TRINITY_DN14316_c0_g1~~TRINITY_DN14316_c0_g1_i4.p1  ORF type:complete len:215 (+),score=29.82 TRINITY_DN14316_c0_g1_i4:86-646(+)